MNKILDMILGLPGLIALLVVAALLASMTNGGTNPKTKCEEAGGKYVQTMKSYHTCKMTK